MPKVGPAGVILCLATPDFPVGYIRTQARSGEIHKEIWPIIAGIAPSVVLKKSQHRFYTPSVMPFFWQFARSFASIVFKPRQARRDGRNSICVPDTLDLQHCSRGGKTKARIKVYRAAAIRVIRYFSDDALLVIAHVNWRSRPSNLVSTPRYSGMEFRHGRLRFAGSQHKGTSSQNLTPPQCFRAALRFAESLPSTAGKGWGWQVKMANRGAGTGCAPYPAQPASSRFPRPDDIPRCGTSATSALRVRQANRRAVLRQLGAERTQDGPFSLADRAAGGAATAGGLRC